eukprot:gb/GFBE01021096.1/.p1 GENE.gb/GFBE01021096.1/~~gb/GFBE01021096.1/.p1  ORF type:complete len:263 (+),score=34.93 gb/GFBE01021096.1/:1-789(+)
MQELRAAKRGAPQKAGGPAPATARGFQAPTPDQSAGRGEHANGEGCAVTAFTEGSLATFVDRFQGPLERRLQVMEDGIARLSGLVDSARARTREVHAAPAPVPAPSPPSTREVRELLDTTGDLLSAWAAAADATAAWERRPVSVEGSGPLPGPGSRERRPSPQQILCRQLTSLRDAASNWRGRYAVGCQDSSMMSSFCGERSGAGSFTGIDATPPRTLSRGCRSGAATAAGRTCAVAVNDSQEDSGLWRGGGRGELQGELVP